VGLRGESLIAIQEYLCRGCDRFFRYSCLGRGRYGFDVKCEAAELYYDTRGSYRRVMNALHRRIGVKPSHVQIFRWMDELGENCKDAVQVAKELHPHWSRCLGLDSKVLKISGLERYLLLAADLGTQDVVNFALVERENYDVFSTFLRQIKRKIRYAPRIIVTDLDPAWFKAIHHVYPGVAVQGCVVHMERIIDRLMPKRNRTVKQEELKTLTRRFLYASSLVEAHQSLREIKNRRDEWTDDGSRQAINSIIAHRKALMTHLKVPDSFRDNNITESIIDKVEMRLKMIRGFKKMNCARNSLRLAIMHYRFSPFLSSNNGNNVKSPLMLAGVNTANINWITYSQKGHQV